MFASTNESFFRAAASQTGIFIEAVGANSFDTDVDRGFWRVRHLGSYGAIQSIQLDWTLSTEPGQHSMQFDIDQDLNGHRHDGGNSTGCPGTYRNDSDLATGLDYSYPGNHAPACATGGENAGFSIDAGNAEAAQAVTYRFTGNSFGNGLQFEFDCDTDGGLGVTGASMTGLVVRVKVAGGTLLSSALSVDPHNPMRAFAQL